VKPFNGKNVCRIIIVLSIKNILELVALFCTAIVKNDKLLLNVLKEDTHARK